MEYGEVFKTLTPLIQVVKSTVTFRYLLGIKVGLCEFNPNFDKNIKTFV